MTTTVEQRGSIAYVTLLTLVAALGGCCSATIRP